MHARRIDSVIYAKQIAYLGCLWRHHLNTELLSERNYLQTKKTVTVHCPLFRIRPPKSVLSVALIRYILVWRMGINQDTSLVNWQLLTHLAALDTLPIVTRSQNFCVRLSPITPPTPYRPSFTLELAPVPQNRPRGLCKILMKVGVETSEAFSGINMLSKRDKSELWRSPSRFLRVFVSGIYY